MEKIIDKITVPRGTVALILNEETGVYVFRAECVTTPKEWASKKKLLSKIVKIVGQWI